MAKKSGGGAKKTAPKLKSQQIDRRSRASAVESAKELRSLAVEFEIAAAEALAGFAHLVAPLSMGNLQEFPRPAPELRSTAQGLEYLRESAERVSDILTALATAREQEIEIPPVLRATVEPFIAALRAKE